MNQFGMTDLLEQAGANPRGRRHDCPHCGGLRTITHSDECFFCHKCQWKGNTVTLAKELGVHRRIPKAEYQELRRKRERAHDAAQRLYWKVESRRTGLLERLHDLNQLETASHEIGPIEAAWECLLMVYGKRPNILAEMGILENATAGDLIGFLLARTDTRKEIVARALQWDGFSPTSREFIEVQV